jgi:hypothetical protein
MNEDERRELIARQHRALYGENSTLYNNNPTSSQDVRVQSSGPGRASPLAFDPFAMQSQGAAGEATVQMPPRGDKDVTGGAQGQEARANSNAQPSPCSMPSRRAVRPTRRLAAHRPCRDPPSPTARLSRPSAHAPPRACNSLREPLSASVRPLLFRRHLAITRTTRVRTARRRPLRLSVPRRL